MRVKVLLLFLLIILPLSIIINVFNVFSTYARPFLHFYPEGQHFKNLNLVSYKLCTNDPAARY